MRRDNLIGRETYIRATLTLGVALLTANSGARAEIFVANQVLPDGAGIYVYDNFDSGLDVAPKRAIVGPDTGIGIPYAVEVYTGGDAGSEAEIFVCGENGLLVFPINAQDNQLPVRRLFEDPCIRMAIYGDEVFVPAGGGLGNGPPMSISIFDYRDELPAAVPDRKIVWDPPGDLEDIILGVDVFGDELFVLISRTNEKDALDRPLAEIWVFDVDAAGIAQEEVRRVIKGHPSLVNGYNLLVSDDEILVSTPLNEQPGNVLPHYALFFDTKASGLAAPFRTLSERMAATAAARLRDKLFFTEFPQNPGEAAIRVYDARSSGVAREKRALAEDQVRTWGVLEDIFVTPDDDPVNGVFELSLEEPVEGAVHSGVGNLRGWAVASDGVERIEVFVDGELFQEAPYGGNRGDVAVVFPEVYGALQSGFSLAYNYSALDEGSHTVSVLAHTVEGKTRTASATFTIARPGREFVTAAEGVDLSDANCSIEPEGIQLTGLIVDGGERWGAVLDWRKASQGFEVLEYRPEE